MAASVGKTGASQGRDSRKGDSDLLTPGLIEAMGRMELLARTKKEGSISGRHASPHKGSSVEFAEYRQYSPGDDLRNLDWRVLGRSDRFYIKQYVEETNLRATLVLDVSGSMAFEGQEAVSLSGRRLRKFDYARHLAAALAYLFIRQQDAVGLVTFDTAIRTYLREMSRPSQIRLILDELRGSEPGGDTGAADVFHDVAERIRRRGLVILISDLFDDPEAIRDALHHFEYRQHELIVFHVMAEEELNFPFRKFTRFRALETAPGMQVDPLAIRSEYLERVRRFVETIERTCGQMKADYVPVNTNRPVEEILTGFLAKRLAGIGGR